METNLLQPFAHPESSDWFSTIFIVVSEVDIVAKQKQAYWNDIFVFRKFPLPSTFLLPPLPYTCSGVTDPNRYD